MRRPRKVKLSYPEWTAINAKPLMKVYIMTPTQVFWGTWLHQQYEEYFNGKSNGGN